MIKFLIINTGTCKHTKHFMIQNAGLLTYTPLVIQSYIYDKMFSGFIFYHHEIKNGVICIKYTYISHNFLSHGFNFFFLNKSNRVGARSFGDWGRAKVVGQSRTRILERGFIYKYKSCFIYYK